VLVTKLGHSIPGLRHQMRNVLKSYWLKAVPTGGEACFSE
jgi:hypothetical protein